MCIVLLKNVALSIHYSQKDENRTALQWAMSCFITVFLVNGWTLWMISHLTYLVLLNSLVSWRPEPCYCQKNVPDILLQSFNYQLSSTSVSLKHMPNSYLFLHTVVLFVWYFAFVLFNSRVLFLFQVQYFITNYAVYPTHDISARRMSLRSEASESLYPLLSQY